MTSDSGTQLSTSSHAAPSSARRLSHSVLPSPAVSLTQAQATALEAETIGANIMSDLRSQRETIMANPRHALRRWPSYPRG